MGYLGGVEQTCSFGARNDACGHAVGDACDEVADVVRSGELGHAGAAIEFVLAVDDISTERPPLFLDI